MTEPRRRVPGLHWISTDREGTTHKRAVAGRPPALPAKSRISAPSTLPTTPVTPPPPPAIKSPTKKAVTVYISPDIYVQARLAYKTTSSAEGDRSWSHFVERAIAAEVQLRAQRHNGGEMFEGVDIPLSPGRPLAE
ncbi:hypothetical protein L5G28_08515 [Gordonia sp. HY285]|uniref:ParB family protein n=1 Tax=Gordonia liuliyuniae TaxID=2911517 RepID=UPI001F4761BA|nr:hypothetical protein [Gordonia liuliyuniae]MCF8610200.1 hypothetical protein [Gordonia liuliyuniae]